ncbi:hypothetical protein RvY_02486 [Ramazzottius varieornatus]|uniref:Uncharacterized protein n=1 Tax=Ramazzottius varieornatus TaxID=947166 RepID=A0A1D1UJU9_RAMVA|nr:hypothetical protein RvY_02486 [Ramazzottius varieornatus]
MVRNTVHRRHVSRDGKLFNKPTVRTTGRITADRWWKGRENQRTNKTMEIHTSSKRATPPRIHLVGRSFA